MLVVLLDVLLDGLKASGPLPAELFGRNLPSSCRERPGIFCNNKFFASVGRHAGRHSLKAAGGGDERSVARSERFELPTLRIRDQFKFRTKGSPPRE